MDGKRSLPVQTVAIRGYLEPVVSVLCSVLFLHEKMGLADAQVDPERGSVICTTLPDEYVKPLVPGIPDIFGPASLHLSDYPAYWDNIRENVQTRIKAYLSKKG